MALFGFLHLSACARADQPSGIVGLTYHFDGTIGRNSHTYTVAIADGTATIRIQDMRHAEYGEMTDTAGTDFIQALEALCAKHHVQRYNGFHGYDRHVRDGKGFSLSIRYANGKEIEASGMNDFPRGYRAFEDDLHALIAPYYARMCETALQRKKAEGVNGPMTCMLVNILQRGNAGRDEYKVLMSRTGIRKPNIDVTIRSVSGEFWPEGEYRYYTDMPDADVPWEAFEALVKKYELVQWMDYDEMADDPNNAERFQLSFSFESGRISASGSAHPEHYDAFRHDFLKLLAELLAKANNE